MSANAFLLLNAVLISSFRPVFFWRLWFACKGTSDSTGGRAHKPQEPNVEV